MKSNTTLKEHELQKIERLNNYVLEVVEEIKQEHLVEIEKKDNTPYTYIKFGGRIALMYYPSKKGLILCVRNEFLKHLVSESRYSKVRHTFGARIGFKEINQQNKKLVKTIILGAVLFEREKQSVRARNKR